MWITTLLGTLGGQYGTDALEVEGNGMGAYNCRPGSAGKGCINQTLRDSQVLTGGGKGEAEESEDERLLPRERPLWAWGFL